MTFGLFGTLDGESALSANLPVAVLAQEDAGATVGALSSLSD